MIKKMIGIILQVILITAILVAIAFTARALGIVTITMSGLALGLIALSWIILGMFPPFELKLKLPLFYAGLAIAAICMASVLRFHFDPVMAILYPFALILGSWGYAKSQIEGGEPEIPKETFVGLAAFAFFVFMI